MKFSASWLVLLVAGPLAHAAAAAPSVPLTPVQRLEPERLEAVHAAREQFAHARQTLPDHGVFEDFRAVLHVHAEDSNHTLGTRAEVLAAAKRTGVRVVMLTDHRGPQTNTWRGLRDGVLFFAGSEDGKGALWFPGFSAEGRPVKEEELRFITHVEERPDTPRDGFAGLEICNRHTDAILDKSLEEHLRAAAKDPAAWRVIADKFARFPDEMFAAGTDYRTNLFVKWDQESATRPFTGIGANDAHQNTVINGLTLDPYEVSFRNLSTHILARELTEPAIREALRSGRVYVSHDWLCDPTGFAFGGVNNLGVFQMGDTVPHIGSSRIVGYTPVPAHLKLFHNGKLVKEVTGTNLTHNAKEFGAYRLEAWLKVGEEERPEVPDMGESIDRRAAGVHPEPSAFGRLDRLDCTGQGVAESERHARFAVFTEVLPGREWLRDSFPHIALTNRISHRYRSRGLAAMHRSPGGVTCEASLSVCLRAVAPRPAFRRPAPILAPCAAGSASSRCSPASPGTTTCAGFASASRSPSSA